MFVVTTGEEVHVSSCQLDAAGGPGVLTLFDSID